MIRLLALCLSVLTSLPAAAQQQAGFSALARFDPEKSAIADTRGGVAVDLFLSQGVPYRVFTLDDPRRLVLDFREVDFATMSATRLVQSEKVLTARAGRIRDSWSRMVLDLAEPLNVKSVDMRIDEASGAAQLSLWLEDGDAESFAAQAGAGDTEFWGQPGPDIVTREQEETDPFGPLIVVLDPGHGGVDPGAEVNDTFEKDLMLAFARDLKEALVRAGDIEVILTREDDYFVSLERRVAIAHRARADVFISLHADALSEGRAKGASVYTLDAEASDAASAALAERHERGDILAGIDLSDSDDIVADILMDLARMETAPRAKLLARATVLGLRESGLPVNSKPLRSAGFSVLKSPGIPSILLELGFLSSDRDLANIADPDWRAVMAVAVADAVSAWRIADEAARELVRQ